MTKCAVKLETKCTGSSYGYQKKCKKLPAIKPVRVKVVECQQCIRFKETVIDFEVAR